MVSLHDNSDQSWEKFGRTDPYYGVLTDPRYRGKVLSEDAKAGFFASGMKHVSRLEASITRYFGGFPATGSALDFGCGAGRVVVPLARLFETVVGVDVSTGMLAEAEANCTAQGLSNVRFARSDDSLSAVRERFDLVHSVIVFQHIPPARGEAILGALLDRLAPGGVIAVQFYYRRDTAPLRRAVSWARQNFAPLHWGINVARGLAWNEPLMQMNAYDLARIMSLFHGRGLHRISLELGDAGSVSLFAQAPPA